MEGFLDYLDERCTRPLMMGARTLQTQLWPVLLGQRSNIPARPSEDGAIWETCEATWTRGTSDNRAGGCKRVSGGLLALLRGNSPETCRLLQNRQSARPPPLCFVTILGRKKKKKKLKHGRYLMLAGIAPLKLDGKRDWQHWQGPPAVWCPKLAPSTWGGW